MKGKLFLAGGGSEELSKEIDTAWKNSLPEKPRVLLIPFARPPEKYTKTLAWFKKAYSFIDFGEIRMLERPDQFSRKEILSFDSIYIGGGNTFQLLRTLRNSGLDKTITEFHNLGKPIYGGSAGAVVLGKTIQTANWLDEKEDIDPRGLDLFPNNTGGDTAAVHYVPSHEQNIKQIDARIIRIAEDGGVIINNEELICVGSAAQYQKEKVKKTNEKTTK